MSLSSYPWEVLDFHRDNLEEVPSSDEVPSQVSTSRSYFRRKLESIMEHDWDFYERVFDYGFTITSGVHSEAFTYGELLSEGFGKETNDNGVIKWPFGDERVHRIFVLEEGLTLLETEVNGHFRRSIFDADSTKQGKNASLSEALGVFIRLIGWGPRDPNDPNKHTVLWNSAKVILRNN